MESGRRSRQLEAAIPETLDVLRATVTAGAAPGQGLQAAADAATGPLAAVFQDALVRHRLGRTAGRALAEAATAAGSPELATAGEALDLAAATGAPPGEVLAAVATAAADRLRARQARLAATAQARLSARVVAAMAPAFLCLLAVVAPGDVAFLLRTPAGWATLVGAIGFETAGMLWARQIVDVAA